MASVKSRAAGLLLLVAGAVSIPLSIGIVALTGPGNGYGLAASVSVLSILVTLAVAWFALLAPLDSTMRDVVSLLQSVKTGEFEARKAGLSRGLVDHRYFGSLVSAVSRSTDLFFNLAKNAAEEGSRISIAAAEMSFFVGSVRKKMHVQVGHANEIAATSEEIAHSTEQIAANAGDAAKAAEDTHAESVAGGKAINATLAKMGNVRERAEESASLVTRLQEQSAQIQVITQVINDISDQTNLLALNAAIEAARAGEHGRGFAVVADEVRQLAQKTKTATDNIGKMLREIHAESDNAVTTMRALVTEVNEAVDETAKVGEQLNKIGTYSETADHRIGQIVGAVREHVQATEQISGAITRIHDELEKTEQDIEHASQLALGLSELAEAIHSSLAEINLNTLHDEMRGLAQQAAAQVQRAFESAVDRGQVKLDDLFDRNYQPIANTTPQKFTTRFDRFTDNILPGIQEPIIEKHPNVAYAIGCDAKGYVPTHNKRYSQPLTGKADVDLWNNRTKRIFSDRTGSRCGANTEPFLLQTYSRDTGEVLHDVSVPIFVKGRHWGGFRLGYRAGQVA